MAFMGFEPNSFRFAEIPDRRGIKTVLDAANGSFQGRVQESTGGFVKVFLVFSKVFYRILLLVNSVALLRKAGLVGIIVETRGFAEEFFFERSLCISGLLA